MYVGVPTAPPPPPESPAADPPTPKVWVPPPPPYSPQNGCTPLGVTHWLAAAPLIRTLFLQLTMAKNPFAEPRKRDLLVPLHPTILLSLL